MKKIITIYILTYFLISQDTLAVIDSQVITRTDFIKRAEYTVRPVYCNSGNNIDKKIILNSLIAEKLLAMKNNGELDIEAVRLLKGIKEQTMRRIMMEDQVNLSLIVNPNMISDLYNRSLFDYEIDFINIASYELDTITEKLKLNIPFNDIIKNLKNKPTQKSINFQDDSNKKIHQEFYGKNINKDDLIGPIKISNNNYILIKVRSKKKNIILTPEAQLSHYNEIENYYIQSESYKIRENYISNIMFGKTIKFNELAFFNLANYYYDEEKKPINKKDILFTLDNKDWRIEDLIEINRLNPILFRDSYNNKSEFYLQFKLALVDLMQNYFLTKKAYELDYSNHPLVTTEVQNWNNYISANYEKEKIINENQNLSKTYNTEYEIIKNILDKELENLFIQNSDKISIDVQMFNDIKLSNIDMLVINTNQPYQLTVPPFPRLTIKNNLDYGTKKDS